MMIQIMWWSGWVIGDAVRRNRRPSPGSHRKFRERKYSTRRSDAMRRPSFWSVTDKSRVNYIKSIASDLK